MSHAFALVVILFALLSDFGTADCPLDGHTLDLYFLQDNTNESVQAKANIRAQMTIVMSDLKEAFPNSRYGVGIFADRSRKLTFFELFL